MPHCSLGKFPFTESHHVTRFVVIKITEVSSGASRSIKQRENRGRKTRKPRDIITSPDHAHMTPAASKDSRTHTDTPTCTLSNKTQRRRSTGTETLASISINTSWNLPVLVVPKRQLWQKCLLLIKKRSKTLNSSGTEVEFCADGTAPLGGTPGHIKLINSTKRTAKMDDTDRQTGVQQAE